MEKAVFIDKDGTIVDNSRYPEEIPKSKLLERDILEGLLHIQKKGYKIIIISNQSWIRKNILSKEEVEEIFRDIVFTLKSKGVVIDDYYYCPHKKEDECNCRKPMAGLFFKAAEKHNIILKNSFMIGDMEEDILAGKSAGMKTILIFNRKGKFFDVIPDYVINNINEVTKII
ncbi:HAD-IIIA family hydrolase [Candidatus Pacearchaeota archaeon]|nr:HAD-IIIA family hydrolase [Candidatus Pacearchaeota archaeon]